MITGDSKETAVSIAKELEIIEPNQDPRTCSFTGQEFTAMSESEKKKAMSGTSGLVYCRVEPKHKRELVKILIELVRFSNP